MTGPLTDENGMIAGTAADVAAPAGWARRAAMQVLDALLLADGWDAQIIACASAIEAADKAATERERERCATLIDRHENGLAQIWRHKKSGGLYRIMNHVRIEASNAPAVAYMKVGGGPIWVRPQTEFDDGRFEKVEDAAIRMGPSHD